MELHHIQALIELLERVRQRPGMYIGPVEHHHLFNYLNGIYTGFRLLGYAPDLSPMETITHQRGWRTNTSFGAYPYMQRKGLSEAAIVHEELTIHIEGWRHIAHGLTTGDSTSQVKPM